MKAKSTDLKKIQSKLLEQMNALNNALSMDTEVQECVIFEINIL